MDWRVVTVSLVFLASKSLAIQSPVGQVQVESAQNLVFKPDGSYSFGYELSDGSFRYGSSDGKGSVFGGYGYKTADGEDINLQYTAGKEGFMPTGAHLNLIPDVPVEATGYDQFGNPTTAETISQQQVDQYFDPNADRSYNFGFQSVSYNRQESADTNGQVVGSYQYIDSAGTPRTLSYTAGAGIGFVPVADYLPQAGPGIKSTLGHTATTTHQQQVGKGFSYQTVTQDDSSQGHALPIPQLPSQLYSTPSQVYSFPNQQALPADSSFQFGYSTGEASRQEESDSAGYVRGQYGYTNLNGNKINVQYSAGANHGFVIENSKELAQSVEKAVVDANAGANSYNYNSQPVVNGAPVFYNQPSVNPENWILSKAYSYGYSGQESSHQQEADSEGNVKGSYTIIDAYGQPLVVRYIAGKNTGFVIENIDELRQRTAPIQEAAVQENAAYSALQSTQNSVQNEHELNKHVPLQNGYEPVARIQPKSQSIHYDRVNPVVPTLPVVKSKTRRMKVVKRKRPSILTKTTQIQSEYNNNQNDKSYSFGFKEDSSSRQEKADGFGNVKGQYSYVNAEGNEIVVKYSATPDGGFVIENKDELAKTLEKATLDGAIKAASFRTSQHRQQAEANLRQTQGHGSLKIAGVQAPMFRVVKKARRKQSSSQTVGSAGIQAPSFRVVKKVRRKQGSYETAGSVGIQAPTFKNSQQKKRDPITLPISEVQAPDFRRRHHQQVKDHVKFPSFDGSRRKMVVVKKKKVVQATKAKGYSYEKPSVPVNLYDTPKFDFESKSVEKSHYYSDSDLEPAPVMMPMDASFDFNYQASQHRREETSDVNGERTGSYSYQTPEGDHVVVRYRAGRNGFEVLNPEDLLPKRS